MPNSLERLNAALAGRYRVLRELGQGGMATVYLAEDVKHRRKVAIKVLTPEIGATIGHARFLREIEIAANLRHPHILPLFDSGEATVPSQAANPATGRESAPAEPAETILFYVMPYAEGESLRDRLTRELQLPCEEAVAIASDVADALHHAHSHGVIHRDIKPENILLEGGHAAVADFGISRALTAAGEDRLTETGLAIGTPAYMSPEQAAGSSELDGRSDVYALGCVVYEMLAGQPPFTGATPRSVIARHAIDPPPRLRTVRDTVPPPLEAAITKALAKTPADRFANAEQFRKALEHATHEVSMASAEEELGRGDRAGQGRWLRVAIAAVATVAVAAVVLLLRLPGAVPLDRNRVMVFPLVAPQAPTASPRLGEDVATLIGNALDKVGSLRWVDGWAELDPARREDVRALTIPDARALARARNCGWFVTGRLVTRSDSVEVFLALHDVAGDVATATGSATGGASDAWRSGLRALNDLLPTLIPGSLPDPSTLWQERSTPALGSFLLAEAAFRRIDVVEALAHYRRAVELDSGFAHAALRGAQAATWAHQPAEGASLLGVALRQSLSPADAAFARGVQYYLAGAADSAIVSLQRAVAEDPEMAAAWAQLGETYTHLLPREGSPLGPAEEAFTEARRLDPRAPGSTTHLIEIWLRRGDARQAAPLLAALRAAGSSDTNLVAKLTIMSDCVTRGPAKVRWDELARERPFPLLAAAAELGAWSPPCTGAAAAALLQVDTSRTEDAESRRFYAELMAFSLLLARGRGAEALAQVDRHVARWGSGTSLYLLAAPVHPVAKDSARAVAARDLERFGAGYHQLPFAKRLWALGVWEAHGGSAEVAATVAAELGARATAGASDNEHVMARSVRAHAALARGDTAQAFALLNALIPAHAPADLLKWDEALPLGTERLALARLLMARGQYREAIKIADALDATWPVINLLYLTASLELRAEAAARLGERGSEARFRERLIGLTASPN